MAKEGQTLLLLLLAVGTIGVLAALAICIETSWVPVSLAILTIAGLIASRRDCRRRRLGEPHDVKNQEREPATAPRLFEP
jgi:hypothetical protein